MIVIALAAAISVLPDSIWSGFTDAGGEILTAGLVIALVAGMAIAGFTGIGEPRLLTTVAILGVLLLVAVIAVEVADRVRPRGDHPTSSTRFAVRASGT